MMLRRRFDIAGRDFTGTDEFEVNLSDSIEQTNRTFRITVQ